MCGRSCGVDAAPAIAHGDLHFATGRATCHAPHRDADPAAVGAVLQRVGDEVAAARGGSRLRRRARAAGRRRSSTATFELRRPRAAARTTPTHVVRRARRRSTGRARTGRRLPLRPAYSSTCSTMSVSRRPFVFDQIAVPPRLCRVVHDARRKILRGRSDDRERRPQLVRDRRDEVHLLRGQPFRSARVDDDEADAGDEHAENAEAQPQIAAPHAARPPRRAIRPCAAAAIRHAAMPAVHPDRRRRGSAARLTACRRAARRPSRTAAITPAVDRSVSDVSTSHASAAGAIDAASRECRRACRFDARHLKRSTLTTSACSGSIR